MNIIYNRFGESSYCTYQVASCIIIIIIIIESLVQAAATHPQLEKKYHKQLTTDTKEYLDRELKKH